MHVCMGRCPTPEWIYTQTLVLAVWKSDRLRQIEAKILLQHLPCHLHTWTMSLALHPLNEQDSKLSGPGRVVPLIHILISGSGSFFHFDDWTIHGTKSYQMSFLKSRQIEGWLWTNARWAWFDEQKFGVSEAFPFFPKGLLIKSLSRMLSGPRAPSVLTEQK